MLLSTNVSFAGLWQLAGMIVAGVAAAPSRRIRRSDRRATAPFVLHNRRPTVPSQVTRALPYPQSKRIFDLAAGSVLLLAGAPLMALTAACIWITLGRPICFSQQRVGRGGRLFLLRKFRTLPVRPVERSEVEWSPRTPNRFAALLRATGLDELPQLINVLRGEMSLVGPRPERPHFVELFQARMPPYARRHDLAVGITGWAQVNGYRGDTSIARRLEHDLYYLRHSSLWFDLRILWRTATGFFANLRTYKREQSPAYRA